MIGIKKFFLVLTLFMTMPAISYSEVNKKSEEWSYNDFCETTLNSYVKAFRDGEREIILNILNESDDFKKISDYQKIAFIKLVDAIARTSLDNGNTAYVETCKKRLEKIKSKTSFRNQKKCLNLFRAALSIRSNSNIAHTERFDPGVLSAMKSQYAQVKGSMKEIWPKEIYYSCLAEGWLDD